MSRSVPHAQSKVEPGCPVRTCVGCRVRASKFDLVRVVADPESTRLLVDAGAGLPGRGAHLHPRSACLDLAQRRQAFTRALRLSGPVDVEQVASFVGLTEGTISTTGTAAPEAATAATAAPSEHPARADQEVGRVDS